MGRHARIALAVVVVATIGANVAVLVQRSSGSAAILATRAPVDATTTTSEEPPVQDASVATEPGPVATATPPAVAHDVSVRHEDGVHAKNIPDKAPVPKAAPSTKPIVGMLDGPDIEGYARYEGQTTCDPTPKPGTVALRNLLLSRYPNTVSFGISRACDVGGVSEHKEGRAFDWGANVNNAAQRASVDAFLAALFATDRYGHRHALARRLGVMYVIWNQQIWGAYRADNGWQPYSGDSPHTDHVHISLSWAGARAETSYYSGKVVPGLPDVSPPAPRTQGPGRPPTPTSTTSTSINPTDRRRRPPPSSTTTTRPSTTTSTQPPTTTTSVGAGP
jgi:hypothetical protein